MSSGLRIRAPQDPDYDPSGPYPDHLYLYTGGVDSYHYAATRPQQWPPNTVGRYRNTDPVLISYLVRLAVEKSGEEYLSFPQRALSARCGLKLIHSEIFSGRAMRSAAGVIGRGSATFIFKMVFGTANAFFRQATRNSSAHRHRLGWPISARFTAPSFGSTVSVSIRSQETLITWRAPAAKPR